MPRCSKSMLTGVLAVVFSWTPTVRGAEPPKEKAEKPASAKSEPKKEVAKPGSAKLPPVSYHRDLWPVIQRQCQGCHQPAKRGGGLVMTSYEALLKGGKNGSAFVPGKPADSLLLQSLKGEGMALMPKGKEALPAREIDLFERWIDEGAKDDSPAAAKDDISPENPPVYEGKPLLTSLAFSRDGSTLAVGGYREVLLHAADGSQLKARLIGLSQRIQSLAYSPDNSMLAAVGGSPGRFGEIQIWDTKTNTLRSSLISTNDTLFGAAWSPDGQKLAYGCADNSFRVIDAKTGKQLLKCDHHTDFVLGTAFSKDGKHMATVSRDRAVKLTQTESGAFIDNITSITPGALAGGVEAIERLPGQDQVAVGGVDGIPKLYRMFRTQPRAIGDDFNLVKAYDKMPGRISAVAFSADGSLLAAAATGEVRVFDVAHGKLISRIPFIGGVYAVAFHPTNGSLAAGGYDGVVKIVEAMSGRVLKEFIPAPFKPPAVARSK